MTDFISAGERWVNNSGMDLTCPATGTLLKNGVTYEWTGTDWETQLVDWSAINPSDPNRPADKATRNEFKGAFVAGLYSKGDMVTYGGDAYICDAGTAQYYSSIVSGWSILVRKGQGIVKAISFTRHTAAPDAPSSSDGTFNSPNASGQVKVGGSNVAGIYWSDGIPPGDSQLYMTSRMFTSDGASPQQSVWSTPQAISKNGVVGQGVRVVFSLTENGAYSTSQAGAEWMKSQTSSDNVTWQDSSIPVKIKGEQGLSVKGDPGQGQVKGVSFTRSVSQPSAPSGGSFSSPNATAAGWTDGVTAGTGKLWQSTRIFTSDGASPQQSVWSTPTAIANDARHKFQFSTDNTSWSDTPFTGALYMRSLTSTDGTNWDNPAGVLIKGERGVQGDPVYTWVAYADDASGSTNFTTGAPAGHKYIGIATNQASPTESLSPASYSWTIIRGDNGADGCSLVLSKESIVIPASSDGTVDLNALATASKNIVGKVIKGGTDDTANWSCLVSSSNTSNLNTTENWSSASQTISLFSAGATLETLTWTFSRTNYATLTKTCTVTKSKQGAQSTQAGPKGASNYRIYAYVANNSAIMPAAPANGNAIASISVSGTSMATWYQQPPTLGANNVMYQCDGTSPEGSSAITWTTPYLSTLKVGSLDAWAVNTGSLTSSSSNSSYLTINEKDKGTRGTWAYGVAYLVDQTVEYGGSIYRNVTSTSTQAPGTSYWTLLGTAGDSHEFRVRNSGGLMAAIGDTTSGTAFESVFYANPYSLSATHATNRATVGFFNELIIDATYASNSHTYGLVHRSRDPSNNTLMAAVLGWDGTGAGVTGLPNIHTSFYGSQRDTAAGSDTLVYLNYSSSGTRYAGSFEFGGNSTILGSASFAASFNGSTNTTGTAWINGKVDITAPVVSLSKSFASYSANSAGTINSTADLGLSYLTGAGQSYGGYFSLSVSGVVTSAYIATPGYSVKGVGRAYFSTAAQSVDLCNGTDALSANGNITASGNVTAYDGSDIRWKENVQPIRDPIRKLLRLSGNTVTWSDEYYSTQNAKYFKKEDVAVIAQEVAAVLPEAVHQQDDGYLRVAYQKLIPLLIEGFKAQQTEIDDLKSIIKELRDDISRNAL
jgi:hypothetical protein